MGYASCKIGDSEIRRIVMFVRKRVQSIGAFQNKYRRIQECGGEYGGYDTTIRARHTSSLRKPLDISIVSASGGSAG